MRKKEKRSFIFLFIICLFITGCTRSSSLTDTVNTVSEIENPLVNVHFIDVGQGDSIFIQSGDSAMLIDAGTNESAPIVTQYLKNIGISHLDWVVGTHPHEDHIGGLDEVIHQYNVDRIMLPAKEHTTKAFENVIDAIESKNLTITLPNIGDTYELGNCEFTVLGPVKDYGDELNNWSIVLRLVCGNNSFLFTGDVESEAEADILAQTLPVKSDVLKVAHHGSDTSSSESFLAAASPKFAVISVGTGNDYGHPCQSTLDKFQISNTQVYRTDLQGTIIAYSDGKQLSFSTSQDLSAIVHITKTGKKYHREGCSALSNSDITISVNEAKQQGYTPCRQCCPPE